VVASSLRSSLVTFAMTIVNQKGTISRLNLEMLTSLLVGGTSSARSKETSSVGEKVDSSLMKKAASRTRSLLVV